MLALGGQQHFHGQGLHAFGEHAAQDLQGDRIPRLAGRQGACTGTGRVQQFDQRIGLGAGTQQRGLFAQVGNGAHDRHVDVIDLLLCGFLCSDPFAFGRGGGEVGEQGAGLEVRQAFAGDLQRLGAHHAGQDAVRVSQPRADG